MFELILKCKFIRNKNRNLAPFTMNMSIFSPLRIALELRIDIVESERRLNLYSELCARVPFVSPPNVRAILIISVEPFIPGIGLIKRGCGAGK